MDYHYSPRTRGFYREVIHGENIPADAVPVTAERHRELMEAQRDLGHAIIPGPDGAPVSAPQDGVGPSVVPAPKKGKSQ